MLSPFLRRIDRQINSGNVSVSLSLSLDCVLGLRTALCAGSCVSLHSAFIFSFTVYIHLVEKQQYAEGFFVTFRYSPIHISIFPHPHFDIPPSRFEIRLLTWTKIQMHVLQFYACSIFLCMFYSSMHVLQFYACSTVLCIF